MKVASCRMPLTTLDIVKNAHQQHASDISLTASLYMNSQDSNRQKKTEESNQEAYNPELGSDFSSSSRIWDGRTGYKFHTLITINCRVTPPPALDRLSRGSLSWAMEQEVDDGLSQSNTVNISFSSCVLIEL